MRYLAAKILTVVLILPGCDSSGGDSGSPGYHEPFYCRYIARAKKSDYDRIVKLAKNLTKEFQLPFHERFNSRDYEGRFSGPFRVDFDIGREPDRAANETGNTFITVSGSGDHLYVRTLYKRFMDDERFERIVDTYLTRLEEALGTRFELDARPDDERQTLICIKEDEALRPR